VRNEVETISGNDTARLMLCLLAFTTVSEADGTSELGVCPAHVEQAKVYVRNPYKSAYTKATIRINKFTTIKSSLHLSSFINKESLLQP
jgi:hypothetical protein